MDNDSSGDIEQALFPNFYTIFLMGLSFIFLLISVICMTVSSTLIKESSCFPGDKELQKAQTISMWSAVLMGLIVVILLFALVSYIVWYRKADWLSVFISPTLVSDENLLPIIASIFLVLFMIAGVMIASSINSTFINLSDCKNKNIRRAYYWSLACTFTGLASIIMLALVVGINIWLNLRIHPLKGGKGGFLEPGKLTPRTAKALQISGQHEELRRRQIWEIRKRLIAQEHLEAKKKLLQAQEAETRKKLGEVEKMVTEETYRRLFPGERPPAELVKKAGEIQIVPRGKEGGWKETEKFSPLAGIKLYGEEGEKKPGKQTWEEKKYNKYIAKQTKIINAAQSFVDMVERQPEPPIEAERMSMKTLKERYRKAIKNAREAMDKLRGIKQAGKGWETEPAKDKRAVLDKKIDAITRLEGQYANVKKEVETYETELASAARKQAEIQKRAGEMMGKPQGLAPPPIQLAPPSQMGKPFGQQAQQKTFTTPGKGRGFGRPLPKPPGVPGGGRGGGRGQFTAR